MKKEVVFTKKEQAKLEIMFNNWMYDDHIRKLEYFRELNESIQEGGILFVGDSITEGYPLYELITQEKTMYGRGIGGYRSSQLLEHIDTMILDLKPSTIFLLIGTNDLNYDEVTPKQVAENIIEICKVVNRKLPETIINLISVYPVNEKEIYKDMVSKRTNEKIEKTNQCILNHIASLKNTKYIDLYNLLLKNGNLNSDYTFDGLHLSIKGYRFVSKVFLQFL